MKKPALLAVLLCACSSSDRPPSGQATPDLTIYFGDLAMKPQPDFAEPPDLETPPDFSVPPGGYRYVVNRILLPMDNRQYAIDLNGDGKVDNQLGNIIGTLATQGLDAQGAEDSVVAAGQAVILARFDADDPMLMNDPRATASLHTGQPRANPKFDGSDRFNVDNNILPANTAGPLELGQYISDSPLKTGKPTTLHVPIALDFFGALAVRVPMNGVEVQFRPGTDAMSGAPGLLQGRIAGSIKSSDVQGIIVPQMAASLNQQIQADPNSQITAQILQIFDGGGCGNAKNGDRVIDVCEVATNAIVSALLAPDVDIYDANDRYAPSAQNAGKDSLSAAIGFTAVRASF